MRTKARRTHHRKNKDQNKLKIRSDHEITATTDIIQRFLESKASPRKPSENSCATEMSLTVCLTLVINSSNKAHVYS